MDDTTPDQPDQPPLEMDSPSAFQALLRWIGRPGYVVRNALKGNMSGALRQAGDFSLGLLDELPMGGLLPQFSRPEDYTEASDLVGGMEPGVAKTAVDVLGGLVTDPLSFLSAPVSAGAKLAKGIKSAQTIAKATNAAQIARKVEAAANGGLDSAQVGADALQQATRPLVEDEARKTLSQTLSGPGKLAKRSGVDPVEDVIQQANGDPDELLRLIQGDNRFQQGGLKLRVPILNQYLPGMETGTLFPGRNLDPLSQSLGFFGGAASMAGTGLRKLGFGDTVDNLGKVGQSIKRGIQAEDLTPGEESNLSDIQNAGNQVANAGGSRVQEIMKGIPEEQRKDLFDVIQNMKEVAPGQFDTLNINARATNPLLDLARPINDTALNIKRATPADIYKQIKDPSLQQDVEELASQVGAEGVANPGAISMGKPGDMSGGLSFVHQLQDQAADKFREQAFPPYMGDPRFASGSDIANRGYIGNFPVKTYGPNAKFAKDIQPQVEVPSQPADVMGRLNEKMGGVPSPEETAAGNPNATFAYAQDQLANWNQRIDSLDRTPEYKDKLRSLAEQFLNASHEQYQEAVERGAMAKPIGQDITRELPVDYASRQFSSLLPEGQEDLIGAGSANKERVLRSNQDLINYLNTNKDVSLERDLGVSAANRASQQGRMVTRAEIGKKMLGNDFTNLTDPDMTKRVADTINEIGKVRPDYADRLKGLWEGMPARGPLMQTIADLNKPFKQAAVMGIAVPRLGSIVGNRLSKPFQAIAQPATQEATLANLAKEPQRFAQDLTGAAIDGMQSMGIGQGLKSGDVGQAINTWEQAAKTGGTPQKIAQMVAQAGGPEGADYAKFRSLGGDDGFVSSEQVIGTMQRNGKSFAEKFGDFWKKPVLQWPAVMWKSVESRMRYGMYKDLTKQGMDPKAAVQSVQDALYDYRVTSKENRALRDVVPFAQFTIKAVKQQAPFVSRTPAVGAALGPVLGANPNDEPVPDYLQGQTHIPIGRDSQGNQKYLAGLRLPIETLNKVPYWGGDVSSLPKQIREDVLSSAAPPLKTAYSYVSGQDPYFGSAFGSYDANPQFAQSLGAGKKSEAGKLYNMLSGTGVIQPVSSLVNTLNAATDTRKDTTDKLLNTLTGAKVVSVDEDQALQQTLTDYLKRNPDVSQYTSFYSQDKDPRVLALTKQLAEVKKRIKDKREAAKSDEVP